VNQETDGLYSKPFITPENLDVKALLAKDKAYVKRCVSLNKRILPFISTANVARDMDGIRAAMGDKKLNYFGFSYGTFLGATYASLFPDNYRALVLDGPVDANASINTPSAGLREQSAGFERAIGRFFTACAVYQSFCNFGGTDPQVAYDALVDQANLLAIPVPDGRAAVNGDDILAATALGMYAKQLWPDLALALSAASHGDGTGIRDLADQFFANNEDGTFDPGLDRYFTITAVEQKYSHDVQTFLDAGDNAWGVFNYTYFNTGYPEINYAIWPIHAKDAFYGPFKASKSAPTILEIATTYDPATPFRGAKRLATQLGNVRFLTMVGDGHTAYLNGSPTCIDPAVVAQIETLTLPAAGTICQQDVPFVPPPATATTSVLGAHSSAAQLMVRFRMHR
jgi:pimeloyl-ACP methyl ester carboxylesterase